MSGFLGQRGDVLAEAAEGGHALRVVSYVFPCGSAALYVEAAEAHDGHRGAGLLPLSDVVHLVQNITDEERWRIAFRGEPPVPAGDPGFDCSDALAIQLGASVAENEHASRRIAALTLALHSACDGWERAMGESYDEARPPACLLRLRQIAGPR